VSSPVQQPAALRQANDLFVKVLDESKDLPSAAKRYGRRETNLATMFSTELFAVSQELQKVQAVNAKRVERTSGKRELLKGVHVFNS